LPGAALRISSPRHTERCRVDGGNPTPGCRARRIITTAVSIDILEPFAFVDNTGHTASLSGYRTVDFLAACPFSLDDSRAHTSRAVANPPRSSSMTRCARRVL